MKRDSNGNKYTWRQCPQCEEEKWIRKEATYCSRICSNLALKLTKITSISASEYQMAHRNVYEKRGKASKCINGCISKKYQWANLTGDFWNIDDYVEMCPSCHKLHDIKNSSYIKGARYDRKV